MLGEKRSKGGCLRYIFMFLNVIFLLFGLGLIGYMTWVMATLPEMTQVIGGTAIFTYIVLGLGAFVCLTGAIGCCASVRGSSCCFKLYVALMVAFLLCEIGGVIYIFVQKDQIGGFIKTAWFEINQDTRNIIQEQLHCCGYNGTTEYIVKNATIDSSCYNETNSGLYTRPCNEALIGWFNENVPIWAAALGVLGVLEILAMLTSGAIMKKIQRSRKEFEDTELRRPTHSRLEYDDEDDEYPDVTYRGNDQRLLEAETKPPPYHHPGRGGFTESDGRPPPNNPYMSTSVNY